MSIRPHPTKSEKEPGKWWSIELGRGKGRNTVVFNGSFEDAARLERSLRQQASGLPVVSVVPKIKELVLPFLDWYKGEASPRTIRDIRFSIDLYFVPWFGNLQPRQLSLQLFQDFKTSLSEKGLAPVTINKHLNYFSSLLQWAVEYGHCQELLFKIPRYQKKWTVAEPEKPLTQRQVDAIYKHLDPKYRLLFSLMADHGLRQEEAMNLRIESINESNKMMTVLGKGHKYRQVPFMSSRFMNELEKALEDRVDGYLVVKKIKKKSGEIVISPYVTMWKPLKKATTAAGITRSVNHKLLRKTFASLAAENGMDPHALQKILGHASIETTNKIYTEVSMNFVGEQGRAMMQRKEGSGCPK
jgi:site-specific recombinase XerD